MKTLYTFVILVLSVSISHAASLEFSYPAEHEQWIDGFVLYENQDGVAVELWATTEKSLRSFTDIDLGTFADSCRSFFMAPFKETKIGPYSDVFEWCPVPEVPGSYYIPADKIQGILVRP